jgi:hypothetical protein
MSVQEHKETKGVRWDEYSQPLQSKQKPTIIAKRTYPTHFPRALSCRTNLSTLSLLPHRGRLEVAFWAEPQRNDRPLHHL